MCYNYNITFPGCRAHKVTTLALCNDRLGERHRIASQSSLCCGLFSSPPKSESRGTQTKKNKKTVDAYRPPPPPPQVRPPPPPPQVRPPPHLNERQMQSMMKLQETYRAKAVAADRADDYDRTARPVAAPPAKGYARRRVPSYLERKALPPLPLVVIKQEAGAPKPTPKKKAPRRPRRSTAVPAPPVRYDDEPLPDDAFIDMVYSYNR